MMVLRYFYDRLVASKGTLKFGNFMSTNLPVPESEIGIFPVPSMQGYYDASCFENYLC